MGHLRLRQHSHPDEANLLDAEDSFLGNRFTEAENKLMLLQSAHERLLKSTSYDYLGHLAAERGDLQGAIDYLTKGIADDQAGGSSADQAMKQMDRAFIECQIGQFERCLKDEQSAMKLNPGFMTYRAASTLLGSNIPSAPVPVAGEMHRLLVLVEQQIPKR